jgi:phospholipid/cholesterol/gamma-HCH transport system substrate-binding protein
MPAGPAVRVGILVFVALLAFVAVAVFLTGYRTRVSGYPVLVTFDDAQGITQGSEVRMAGVTVGVVDKVSLDRRQRAVMRLLINQKFEIPVGSEFVLRIGLLIGDKYVDILPKRGVSTYYKACDRIAGHVPPRPEDMLPKVNKLLDSLTRTSNNLDKVIGNKQFQQHLNNTLANLETATAKLNRTIDVVQGTVVANQDDVAAIVKNVVAASRSLQAFTDQLAKFPKTSEWQGNISAMLEAARQSADSLERSTESLEKLITSPDLQEDVRQTVKEARAAVVEARATVEEAHQVVDHVSHVLGVTPKHADLGVKANFRAPSLDAMIRPADGNVRVNGYFTIPKGGKHFLRLGVFDLGENNNGILQPGQSLNCRTDLRYGIYASRLGVGVDYGWSPRLFGSANLYDQNEPRLDVQAGYKINDDWGVLLGVDKLFWENQITLGAHFQK